MPGARDASVSADGHFNAPQAFDPNNPGAYQLAQVGSSSRTSAEAYSFTGFGDRPSINDVSQSIQVSSFASFNDYLLLGAVRPNSMSLVFELTGDLDLHPLFTSPTMGAEAQATYTVSAQSVTRLPDGVFASVSPFARGDVIVNQRRATGSGAAVTQTTLSSDPGSSFTHTSTPLPNGATRIEIGLGPDFFANPDNAGLLLGMGCVPRRGVRASSLGGLITRLS